MTPSKLNRDKLFLLTTNFADPAYPGRKFYCYSCFLVEGLLAVHPELLEKIDVERVEWPRPREKVVALVGEANQSLPLLILANGETSKYQTGSFNGHALISDPKGILHALAERHGVPEPHP